MKQQQTNKIKQKQTNTKTTKSRLKPQRIFKI